MSRPIPRSEEYRSAAVTVVGTFALLIVVLMVKMSVGEIFTFNVLLAIGALSLVAGVGDFIIKYRRLLRGISTEDLVRQVERDFATGQHVMMQSQFRKSMLLAGGVAGLLLFLLGQFLG